MSSELILPLILRWVHIVSATLAVGVPIFVRFVLVPAVEKALPEEQREELVEAVNKKWRHIVYLLITLFLITGLIQFLVPLRVDGVLVTARWKGFASQEDVQAYHMLFGIKVLAAFGIFFLLSALAGRTKTFAPIRAKRKLFLSVVIALAAIVILCANLMHYLPRHGMKPAVLQGVSGPVGMVK